MKLLHFGRVVVRVVAGCRSNYLRFCKDLAPAGCRKKKRSVCLSICGPGAEPWPKAEEGSAQGGSHPRCGTTSPQAGPNTLRPLRAWFETENALHWQVAAHFDASDFDVSVFMYLSFTNYDFLYWSVIYGCVFDPSFNYLLFCIQALFIVPFKQEPRPPSKHIDDLG